MSKPGRNEPCYCGSGEKYKKCHMKLDKAADRERRAWAEAGKFLRRDLLLFARDERFAIAFAEALPLFWDGLYELDNAEQMSQDEAVRFIDWFFFDYDWTNEEGGSSRLIEVYHAEKQGDLTSHQQDVLDEWLTADAFNAYTLNDYDGQTLQLSDYMTGEAFEVYEGGGRGVVEIGEVLLVRLVSTHGRMEFSTAAAYLPADEIAGLTEKLTAAEESYMADHPDAAHTDFMRRHNIILVHHALEQAKVQGRAQVARLDPDRPDTKTQTIARQMKRFRK